jgi:hypothetical protein
MGADRQKKITGLDGIEKTYTFVPLVRMEAAEVLNTTVRSVLATLEKSTEAAALLFSESGGGDEQELAVMAKVAASAFQALTFKEFWGTARKLLRGCVIMAPNMPVIEIKSLDDCDYFTEHPEELYVACFKAVMVTFPNFFSHAMAKIVAFFARDKEQTTSKE